MKRFSVVLVTLAVIFASFSSYADYKDERSIPDKNSNRVAMRTNWKPFLPENTAYSERDGGVGIPCDKNGQYNQNQQGLATYRCVSVHSIGEKITHYRIRSSGAEGDRIFLVKNGKPKLYVQFTGGSDNYRVVYQAPEAQRFAEKNGYVLDKRNNTMVAIVSTKNDTQVAQQPKSDDNQVADNDDCAAKGSTLEKAKCVMDKNGTGTAIGAVIKGLPKF